MLLVMGALLVMTPLLADYCSAADNCNSGDASTYRWYQLCRQAHSSRLRGDVAKAEHLYRLAFSAGVEANVSVQRRIDSQINLADALVDQNRCREAELLLLEQLKIVHECGLACRPVEVRVIRRMIRLYTKAGRSVKLREATEKLIALSTQVFGSTSAQTMEAENQYCDLLEVDANWKKLEHVTSEVLDRLNSVSGTSNHLLMLKMLNKSRLALAQSFVDRDNAQKSLREVVGLIESSSLPAAVVVAPATKAFQAAAQIGDSRYMAILQHRLSQLPLNTEQKQNVLFLTANAQMEHTPETAAKNLKQLLKAQSRGGSVNQQPILDSLLRLVRANINAGQLTEASSMMFSFGPKIKNYNQCDALIWLAEEEIRAGRFFEAKQCVLKSTQLAQSVNSTKFAGGDAEPRAPTGTLTEALRWRVFLTSIRLVQCSLASEGKSVDHSMVSEHLRRAGTILGSLTSTDELFPSPRYSKDYAPLLADLAFNEAVVLIANKRYAETVGLLEAVYTKNAEVLKRSCSQAAYSLPFLLADAYCNTHRLAEAKAILSRDDLVIPSDKRFARGALNDVTIADQKNGHSPEPWQGALRQRLR